MFVSIPYIFLYISINNIPPNLVFIMYLLYFYFLILLLINHFDTLNRFEYDFSALRLTGNKECDFRYFFAYVRCFDKWYQYCLLIFYVSSYIASSRFLILALSRKHITDLFHIIHDKTIILPFLSNHIDFFFRPIIRYSSSK